MTVVVTVLTDRDVLLGRGAPIAHYVGNVNFRKYIHTRKNKYASRSRHDHKQFIAQQIYEEVTHEWNGRFLAKMESSDIRRIALGIAATTKAWVIAPKDVALEKIKQALRDKSTPSSSNELPSWHSTTINNNENQDTDKFVGSTNNTAGGTMQSNATMNATLMTGTPRTGLGIISTTGANSPLVAAVARPPHPAPIALFLMQRQLDEAEQKRRQQQQQQQQLLLLLLQQQQQQNSPLSTRHHVVDFAASPPPTTEPTTTTTTAAAGYNQRQQLDLRNQLVLLNCMLQQQQRAGISNVETTNPPMNHKEQ